MKTIIENYIKAQEPKNYNLFLSILDNLKIKNNPNYTMLELGCAQGYYSALFRETFDEKAKNILVEPVIKWWHEFGSSYFDKKNNWYFYNNYIGELMWENWGGQNCDEVNNIKNSTQEIALDTILNETNTDFIDLLHMDMQGTEYYILEYIIDKNIIDKIDYIFIATHYDYNRYTDLIAKSNHEYVFNNPEHRDYGDGLIIIKNRS
jgi:FkbM family methyltransferase